MKQITIIILFALSISEISGQSRKELEDQRKKTLEEIVYVDNMIKETEKQKVSGINDIRIIGNKVNLREKVITGLHEEIELLMDRIETNNLAISMMEKDLAVLKAEYAATINNSYKSGKGYPEIAYVLSAKDFNQGYKRMKYLQQTARFRRREAEIIAELKGQIEATREKLNEDLLNVTDLKSKEEKQKASLMQEQDRKRRMVNTLGKKEKQLKKELEEKKRAAQRIEAEIHRIIEEERKRSVATELTPEMKLIGDNFNENKGRLPWPVEKGIITSKFGSHDHPILTYVKENNIGIEITSSGVTKVRTVFKGQIVRVFALTGYNMSIIIKHGKYYTAYQNLVNVKVKQGEMVETKQEIGEVFCDIDKGATSILKFMIFEEKEKKDPEQWIAKK